MTVRPRVMLALAALGAVATWLLSPASPRVPGDGPAASARSSDEPGPTAEGKADPEALAAPGLAAVPGVDVVERMLPLDARLEVEIVHKKSGAPIAGIVVRASLNFHEASFGTQALEFWQTRTTGADGVAAFDEFPRRTTVTIVVRAEGFRRASVDVTLGRSEASKRLRIELHPGLSAEKSSVRVTLPDGVKLPGIGVRYLDRTNGGVGHASPEAALVLDDDPDAPAEHDVDLQLVLPGYAGTRVVRRLRRGTSLELSPPSGERVVEEIALVDEEGRGFEALAVSVWPTASSGASTRFTELAGTTDARGVVALEGYRGTTWRLDADPTRVQFPDRSDQHPFEVGGARPTFRAGRRLPHRLVFDGEGLPARGRAELVWRSYQPMPGSALERLFRDEPARFDDRIRRYVERLPRVVDWQRLPSGVLAADLALLPGTYLLAASTDRLLGRETTLQAVHVDDETVVSLARTSLIRVKVEGSFDRTDGPLPYRTIVLAHRAGFDERAEIARVLGEEWGATAARGPLRRGSDFDEAHTARMERTALALARMAAPTIGRDLAYAGREGTCEIEAMDAPRGVTVFFPDLRVAYVPVEGDGTTFRARVEPSNFRRLAVRVHRVDGNAFAAYPVAPASIEALRAGRFEIGAKRPTDAEGVVLIGILGDEAVGLHPGFDVWTVTTGAGASVDRLDTGYIPSYVIRTRTDVIEPAIDVIVEPHDPK